MLKDRDIRAGFKEFSLRTSAAGKSCVVVPTVRSRLVSKLGAHAYYFFNFEASKGLCVTVPHREIVLPGLGRVLEASRPHNTLFSAARSLFAKYHYGLTLFGELLMLTIPHGVTDLGDGKFLVNLWAYYGFLEIDCRERRVTYRVADGSGENHVFGSQQWYDAQDNSRYFATFSMEESYRRAADPRRGVFSRILKTDEASGETVTVWQGQLFDYLHDIVVNSTRTFLVACELGLYTDHHQRPVPSKVLIVDLQRQRHWIIDRFFVAAHAQFDPVDPDVVYMSAHNFSIHRSEKFNLFSWQPYSVDFLGPASIRKYRLTPDGPMELGVFSHPDMFRMTNFHVFLHRGRKTIAAMGAPNLIFIADAETFDVVKKIAVTNLWSVHDPFHDSPIPVGSISPSIDGEKLFVQTTRSFQIVDVETGRPEYVRHYFSNHACANHMLTSSNTAW